MNRRICLSGKNKKWNEHVLRFIICVYQQTFLRNQHILEQLYLSTRPQFEYILTLIEHFIQ